MKPTELMICDWVKMPSGLLEIRQIDRCDYTDNRELIEIIGKLADMVQSILHEL